jgi:hypothetical protein
MRTLPGLASAPPSPPPPLCEASMHARGGGAGSTSEEVSEKRNDGGEGITAGSPTCASDLPRHTTKRKGDVMRDLTAACKRRSEGCSSPALLLNLHPPVQRMHTPCSPKQVSLLDAEHDEHERRQHHGAACTLRHAVERKQGLSARPCLHPPRSPRTTLHQQTYHRHLSSYRTDLPSWGCGSPSSTPRAVYQPLLSSR